MIYFYLLGDAAAANEEEKKKKNKRKQQQQNKKNKKRRRVVPAYPLTVRNTVHTAVYDTTFNLPALAIALKGRYGGTKFPAASFRLIDPFVTLSLFRDGKVVITGTDDFEHALLAACRYQKLVRDLTDIQTRFTDFRLENIVCSLALGYGLDLPRFYADFSRKRNVKIHYRESFPGLQYWPGEDQGLANDEKKVVVILFYSGCIVIAGAKCKDEAEITHRNILGIVEKYRLVV